MEPVSLKKITSPKAIDLPLVRKIRRLYHIKSMPAYGQPFSRKQSHSKIEGTSRDQPELKIRKFKTQHHLKHPLSGTIRTARDKNAQAVKKKDLSSQPSKSLTKSTTFRSPQGEKERRKSRVSKQKKKPNSKKIYSGMLDRVRQVVQQYQLKLDRCFQQKQAIARQNTKLKKQLQSFHRRSRRH